jgi:hypothetical protein
MFSLLNHPPQEGYMRVGVECLIEKTQYYNIMFFFIKTATPRGLYEGGGVGGVGWGLE